MTSPTVRSLFVDGWYAFARREDSPNFGPRPAQAEPDLVVIHSISLPPGEYGGPGVRQLFTNTLDWSEHPYYDSIRGMEVSAHFFITRLGELWQFVSVLDRAWHAGASSYRGRDNCNNDSIGIELEGIEGGPFEDAQYETLAELICALHQHWPLAHVAGHEHVSPGRKADPGAGFDWLRLSKALGLESRCFPEGVLTPSSH